MAIGLVGKKCGMTRIFTEAGESIPVTVVEVHANPHYQSKKYRWDWGYQAIQVTTGTRRDSRRNCCTKRLTSLKLALQLAVVYGKFRAYRQAILKVVKSGSEDCSWPVRTRSDL